MRIQTSLLLAFALVACGQNKNGGKGDDGGQQVAPAAETTGKNTDPHHSLLVADASKLPTCDDAGEGWLVYLKSESKFKACTAGEWLVVDIKGEKGEKGDSGTAGAAGAGADTPSAKEWKDPTTNRTWKQAGTDTFDQAGQHCTAPWVLPNKDAMKLALDNGLRDGFGDDVEGFYKIAWTSTGTGGVINQWYAAKLIDSSHVYLFTETATTFMHGIYCYREP